MGGVRNLASVRKPYGYLPTEASKKTNSVNMFLLIRLYARKNRTDGPLWFDTPFGWRLAWTAGRPSNLNSGG